MMKRILVHMYCIAVFSTANCKESQRDIHAAPQNKKEITTESSESVDNERFNEGLYVCVAAIGGVDTKARQAIQEMMEKNGIDSYSEGSVLYGVYVEEKYARKAVKILMDRALQKYDIEIADKFKLKNTKPRK